MKSKIFELKNIRIEISFKSFDELRLILSFFLENDLCKINIPCKNTLKKEFLLDSIKIARKEFPSIDLIPHFSIFHEFKRNRLNTLRSFSEFSQTVNDLGCKEILLVSGSQKRSTLDSASTLNYLKDNNLSSNSYLSIGVALNPYLPSILFDEEILKLEKKLQSGLVTSIWMQFGTDSSLLESRIEILKKVISKAKKSYHKNKNINLFGSILIPSKQFLARFKYRPWKGVYCSHEFLESVDFANDMVVKLLQIYSKYKICPIIETDVSNKKSLDYLKEMLI